MKKKFIIIYCLALLAFAAVLVSSCAAPSRMGCPKTKGMVGY